MDSEQFIEQENVEVTEQAVVDQIDLFADSLPSLAEIQQLTLSVNSSTIAQIEFSGKLEDNLSKSGGGAKLSSGIGLYILGRNEEAVEAFAKASDCQEKFIYLAYALRRLGNYAEAISNLDKSLKHQADSLSITLEKASTYRHAGELGKAESELKSCANFEKVSSEYHYQVGRLQEIQGDYSGAMDNYKAALELTPGHQKALFYLAYRSDLSGDEEAAIDYYKQISASSPVFVNALLNLAILYEDQDDFERASDCVELVLKYHPNHQRALLFKKDVDSSKTMYYDEEREQKKTRKTQILETPISDFELSVRSRNCLQKMNIRTIGDLLNITESELLSYKNFGETSLREIKAILDSKTLHLGMVAEEKLLAALNVPEGSMSSDEIMDDGLLSKPVEDLQLSVRARKCVQRLNLRSLGELTRKTEAELLGCKNFGVTSLNEIKRALTGLGLSLRTLE